MATKKVLEVDKKFGLQVNRYIADAKYWNDKNIKFQSCFMIFLHVPKKERQTIFSNINKNLHLGGKLFIEGFSSNRCNITEEVRVIQIYYMTHKQL